MKLKAPAAAATARSPVNWFLEICVAAFFTVISASAAADPQASAEEWTPTEQWVVERVTAGEEADLLTALNPDRTKKFPKQEDRKLSAHFLQELLKGTLLGVQPQRIGVRILWATIDESIDINNERIPWDIWLEHCQFMSRATIHHASFAWNVSFQNSTFKDFADFNSIKVGNIAWFIGADFEGPVDFRYADINGEFGAQGATFQNNENGGVSRAVFSGMKVGGDATFYSAVFEGPVDFSYANIANNFNANDAEFQDQKNGAVFSGMKVGNDALFAGAEFEGPVDFSYANIANNFNANDAEFQDQKNGAVFSGMRVGGDATFYSAVFNGPMHFNHADFARLSLSSPFSPKVAAQFHMQGMSYKYIRAVSQPEPSPRLDIIPLRAYPLYPASPGLHIIPARPPSLYRESDAFIRAVLQPEPSSGSHIIPAATVSAAPKD